MGGRGNPSEGLDCFIPHAGKELIFFFFLTSQRCYRFDAWSGGPWLQNGGAWGVL